MVKWKLVSSRGRYMKDVDRRNALTWKTKKSAKRYLTSNFRTKHTWRIVKSR